jgi:hypothetical protein
LPGPGACDGQTPGADVAGGNVARDRLLGLLALLISIVPAFAGGNEGEESLWSSFSLNGSANLEYFRSEGVSRETEAVFNAFRQRYGLDLAGTLWDPRFNRFSLGVDFFRNDWSVDGERFGSNTLGYRAVTTFFPARPFPLRLFARRASTDSSGASLADSDRETAAWGVEWNIATPLQQKILLQYDRTSYDLLFPLALQERRSTGNIEFTQTFEKSEFSIHHGIQEQKELVNGSDFRRQFLNMSGRTRFDNDVTVLVNSSLTDSDALFSSGERDDLTWSRISGVVDVPRKNRLGVNINYAFNDNSGKFVDSTSHSLRTLFRIRIADHWDSDAAATVGRLDSVTRDVDITEDLAGIHLGIRYHRDWTRCQLSTGYAFGFTGTRFNTGPDRSVTNHAADAELRVPFDRGAQTFYSLSYKQDQTDLTGLGYTFDEARATVGIEGRIGESTRAAGSLYARDSTYDTFQFGTQDSTEVGIEGSVNAGSGGASVGLARSRGISDFIPDPSSGSPFTSGTDLVNKANVATLGGYWRFPWRLQFRMQARYEDRDFSSIGKERIMSYHPEIEWTPGVWRLSLGLTHYERNNQTTFKQDTLLVRISRLFF